MVSFSVLEFLIDKSNHLIGIHLSQPLSHFASVLLPLSDHLFVFNSTFFEDTPSHIHEYLHSSVFDCSCLSFLLAQVNSFLPFNGLDQYLLLMLLRPVTSNV